MRDQHFASKTSSARQGRQVSKLPVNEEVRLRFNIENTVSVLVAQDSNSSLEALISSTLCRRRQSVIHSLSMAPAIT